MVDVKILVGDGEVVKLPFTITGGPNLRGPADRAVACQFLSDTMKTIRDTLIRQVNELVPDAKQQDTQEMLVPSRHGQFGSVPIPDPEEIKDLELTEDPMTQTLEVKDE